MAGEGIGQRKMLASLPRLFSFGRGKAEDQNTNIATIGWSSTTALKMALLNHRRFLGFEINPKYVKLARRRLKDAEATMASRIRKAN